MWWIDILKIFLNTYELSFLSLALAGPDGRPSVGIQGTESVSSSFTFGAKWTLLKDGGGGNTTATRSVATLLLLGTLTLASVSPDSSWSSGEKDEFSSEIIELPIRLFLLSFNQKQNYFIL